MVLPEVVMRVSESLPPTEIPLEALLDRQQLDPLSPPLPSPKTLPFGELAPDVFERLVAEILLKAESLEDIRIYGRTGQHQGGLDLVGRRKRELHVCQVRRIKELTPKSLEKAVRDFAGPSRSKTSRADWTTREFEADRFILATGSQAFDTAIELKLNELRDEYFGDIRLDLYDAWRLCTILRYCPRIVWGVFGRHWAEKFCGELTSAENADHFRDFLQMTPSQPHEVVPRTELLDPLIETLCSDEDAENDFISVCGIWGLGGVGKTTLAKQLGSDKRILQRFTDGILWATIGEDMKGASLAGCINGIASQVSGREYQISSAEQAGQNLARLLSRGKWLLVVDDVWREYQITPFLIGNKGYKCVVTTRNSQALPQHVQLMQVQPMAYQQARQVLLGGLPKTSANVEGLLTRAKGWPVLLKLMNRWLYRHVVRYGMTMADAAAKIKARHALYGPSSLDMTSEGQRQAAVTATIEVSLSELVSRGDFALPCFLSLAIFPEDSLIPLSVLQAFWTEVYDCTPWDVEDLCADLADLSLIQELDRSESSHVRLHDVIRQYLRHRKGVDLVHMNKNLLDVYRPAETPGDSSAPWWTQDRDQEYLHQNLGFHLSEAKLQDELMAITQHERWFMTVLEKQGVATAVANLQLARLTYSKELQCVVELDAMVLSPLVNLNSLTATLVSRLEAQGSDFTGTARFRALLSEVSHFRTSLPSAESRIHAYGIRSSSADGSLNCVSFSPERQLLISGRSNGEIRAEGAKTNFPQVYRGLRGRVCEIAFSKDASWFAASSNRGMVALWGIDEDPIALLSSRANWLSSFSLSGPAENILTGGYDGYLSIWNPDGEMVARWKAHKHGISAVSAAHNSLWTVSGCADGSVRLWQQQNQPPRELVSSCGRQVRKISVSADDRAIVASVQGGLTCISPDSGEARFLEFNPGPVKSFDIDTTSQSIVAGFENGTVVWWSLKDYSYRILGTHESSVFCVKYSRDDHFIVSCGLDRTVRLWDASSLEFVAAIRVKGQLFSLDWSEDSKAVYAVGANGLYRLDLVLAK